MLGRSEPDYGVIPSENPVPSSMDNAELAARLGSPVIHSRTGRVAYIDDFKTYNWYTVGGTPRIVANHSRLGQSCMRLGLIADGPNAAAEVYKYISYESAGSAGLEMCFGFNSADDLRYTFLRTDFVRGAAVGTPTYNRASIRIDWVFGKIAYYNAGGGHTNLADITPSGPGTGIAMEVLWHTIKYTFDYVSNAYKWIQLDSQIINFPPNSKYESVASADWEDYTSLVITHQRLGANYDPIYVQSVIMTLDEP